MESNRDDDMPQSIETSFGEQIGKPRIGVGADPQQPHLPLEQSTRPAEVLRPPNPPQLQQPGSTPSFHRPNRKVPSYLRGHGNKDGQLYEPALVSLGPYHACAKPEFFQSDMLKEQLLFKFIQKRISENVADACEKGFMLFYKPILENIDEIRAYYEDFEIVKKLNYEAGPNLIPIIKNLKSCNEYNPFALMILHDACYIASCMDDIIEVGYLISDQLGAAALTITRQDLYKLENQIPFHIVKRVLDSRFGKAKGDKIVCEFLSYVCFMNRYQLNALPWEDDPEHPPLHVIEAFRKTFLKTQLAHEGDGSRTESHFLSKIFRCGNIWQIRRSGYNQVSIDDMIDSPFRSVTYLQKKGISVRSNSSYSLTSITFTSNPCYGTLHLPTLFINNKTKVLFSNLIAFEMSAGFETDFSVTCYINFMKSLIETPEDVKKLQEKHILCSLLGNDEEIVETFKEISNHGMHFFGKFVNVRKGIDEHCDSKMRTWMSELHYNYFHSPWSIIVLIGAVLTLIFTFLQVYFTVYPPKKNK